MSTPDTDLRYMQRACELAVRGEGYVEPNPQVGCVIVQHDQVVGEGWHGRFGGPHAEVEALRAAGEAARGATLYVTLEPCCHTGKTPPCTQAILQAGIRRVVLATRDPFAQVSGGGIAALQAAGVEVDVGVGEAEARTILAPYWKLTTTGRPWVIAKWAMTLDGRIATASGESKWISGEASRALVHQLRGRMDAILIGRQTLLADDPLLTARPPGPRTALRVVFGQSAEVPLASQLVRTAKEVPTLIAYAEGSSQNPQLDLKQAGCEQHACRGQDLTTRLASLLAELGRRRITNVLVEGGAQLLGALRDLGQIDEVHTFVGPRILGQTDALSPVLGSGAASLAFSTALENIKVQQVGEDAYISGRVKW